jgi:hypothetical protein
VDNAENQDTPTIDFAGFVLSLATTAALHFGDIEDPNTGRRPEPNLEAARQMIEIIGMLQEKTSSSTICCTSFASGTSRHRKARSASSIRSPDEERSPTADGHAQRSCACQRPASHLPGPAGPKGPRETRSPHPAVTLSASS